MTRWLMGTREARLYLIKRHGVSRSQGCISDWLREGRILPVLSYKRTRYTIRLTTAEQIDMAVRDGRVPPGPRRRRTRGDRRNEVTVQLMDEFGLILVEARQQQGGEEE